MAVAGRRVSPVGRGERVAGQRLGRPASVMQAAVELQRALLAEPLDQGDDGQAARPSPSRPSSRRIDEPVETQVVQRRPQTTRASRPGGGPAPPPRPRPCPRRTARRRSPRRSPPGRPPRGARPGPARRPPGRSRRPARRPRRPGRRPGPRRRRRPGRRPRRPRSAPGRPARDARGGRRSSRTWAGDAPFWGPKTSAASVKAVLHVAGHHQLDAAQAMEGLERLDGPVAAVGRGRPAQRHHAPDGPGLHGQRDQLAGARRGRRHRVVALGPADQGQARRPGHLDHRGAAVRGATAAWTGSPSGPVTHDCAGWRRPARRGCPHRRRPAGTASASQPEPGRRGDHGRRPPRRRWRCRGTCRERRPASSPPSWPTAAAAPLVAPIGDRRRPGAAHAGRPIVEPMQPIVLVSNRGPLSWRLDDDGRPRSPGGAAAASSPAWPPWSAAPRPSGSPRRSATATGRPPSRGLDEGDGLRCRLLAHDPDVLRCAYDVVGNAVLWFIHHGLYDLARRPRFDRTFAAAWEGYRRYNATFADAGRRGRARPAPPCWCRTTTWPWWPPTSERPGPTCASSTSATRRSPDPTGSACSPTPTGPSCWPAWPPTTPAASTPIAGRPASLGSCRGLRRARPRPCRVTPLGPDPADLEATADGPACAEAGEALAAAVGDRRLIVRVDRIELSKNLLRGFWAYDQLLERPARLAGAGHVRRLRLPLPGGPGRLPGLPPGGRRTWSS